MRAMSAWRTTAMWWSSCPLRSLLTHPFGLGRLVSYSARGQRYRISGWMYLFAFTNLLILQGRSYYLGPATCAVCGWGRGMGTLAGALPEKSARRWIVSHRAALALGALSSAALTLPIAPVNSALWDLTAEVHNPIHRAETAGWSYPSRYPRSMRRCPRKSRRAPGILAGN